MSDVETRINDEMEPSNSPTFKVHLRKDLGLEGLAIPCLYQDGAFLTASEIEKADFLGTIQGGTEYVLLLEYINGYRPVVVVASIDLDFTN